MNKLLSKIILFTLLFGVLPVSAYDFKVGAIYYNVISLTELTCEVTSGDVRYAGNITIPPEVTYNNRTLTVTTIGANAFYECTALTYISIPNSVTSIGKYAFRSCTALVSITIPNSVTTIRASAFDSCTSLTSITIPNSVTSIGEYAFGGCTSLTSITIPNSVTTIVAGAFNSCTSLTSITIPNSVTSIGEYAFGGCTSLTSITIPNSVTTIGAGAFRRCHALESINLSTSLKEIEYGLFQWCESLNNLEIPGSVLLLSQYYEYRSGSQYYFTFGECNNLSSLKLAYHVQSLNVGYRYGDTYMFIYEDGWSNWTKNLQELYIDRRLETPIPVPNLKKLVIGEHMNSVQVENISSLSKLTTIECLGLTPPILPTMSNSQYINIMVYVPEEALATYQAHPNWGKFWNLRAATVNSVSDSIEKTEVARYNLSGIPVDDTFKGFVIVRFSDGTYKKLLNQQD